MLTTKLGLLQAQSTPFAFAETHPTGGSSPSSPILSPTTSDGSPAAQEGPTTLGHVARWCIKEATSDVVWPDWAGVTAGWWCQCGSSGWRMSHDDPSSRKLFLLGRFHMPLYSGKIQVFRTAYFFAKAHSGLFFFTAHALDICL